MPEEKKPCKVEKKCAKDGMDEFERQFNIGFAIAAPSVCIAIIMMVMFFVSGFNFIYIVLFGISGFVAAAGAAYANTASQN